MGRGFEPGECALGADAGSGHHQRRRTREALPSHRPARQLGAGHRPDNVGEWLGLCPLRGGIRGTEPLSRALPGSTQATRAGAFSSFVGFSLFAADALASFDALSTLGAASLFADASLFSGS